jgi:Pyridoxamine 5'-phosphate oxidase
MTAIPQQRRGRSIAMAPAELDAFLTEMRTARVATMSPEGPHVAPLWFVWSGGAIWLSSLVRSQRWTDVLRDPRVAVVVDAGHDYGELRGAEIRGTAEPVGEVPRRGTEDPQLAEPEQLLAGKYGGGTMGHDGRHAWLRITPTKITSWDFRKLPADRRRPSSEPAPEGPARLGDPAPEGPRPGG